MPRSLPQLGLAIALLALGVRLGYWGAVTRDPSQAIYEFHLVQGAPYADAYYWDRLAAGVSRGEGVSGTGWEARRPFYAYFLGLIYAWTGPHYAVAQGVNIALSTLSVWLLYDLGRRLCGPAAGAALGLWAAWHPTAVCLCLITLTETLGWLLIIAHVHQSVRAVTEPRRHAWTSGLLFAASNLTRTLTLLALPGLVLWLAALCRRAGASWGDAARGGLRCAAGALALLLPFMFLQWWNFGVFTLSSNSAGDLYAASSPQFGRWSFEVEKVADAAGAVTIKERYNFFMREARKNLRQHPRFFLDNFRRTTTHAWNEMQTLDLPGGWLTFLAALALAHVALGLPPRDDAANNVQTSAATYGPALAAAAVGLAAALEAKWPGLAPQALAGVAVLRALLLIRGEGLGLIVNYLAFTLLAVGMFAAVEPRLVMFVQWSLLALVAAGFATLWQAAVGLLGQRTVLAQADESRRVVIYRANWRWRAKVAALLLAPIPFRAVIHGFLEPDLAPPSRRNTLQLLSAAAQQAPQCFSDAELPRLRSPATELRSPAEDAPALGANLEGGELPSALAPLLAAPGPASTDGKLLVLQGVFDVHVYRFAAGSGGNHLTQAFARREYGRTIAHFHGYDALGTEQNLKVLLPHPWRPPGPRQTWLLVARGNAALREYTNATLEAIAAVPAPRPGHSIDYQQIHWFDNPQHQSLVRQWAAPLDAP